MSETKRIRVIVSSAILLLGLITIMSSLDLGDAEMIRIMSRAGGEMDTGTYLVYLAQSIAKYRLIGAILASLGGIGLLINTHLSIK